ncbi:MAG TPA: glycosyl hydrolase 53 family protein, partial [Opitutales bacterium]|nr:glycosyl hydrolase 53 family protein [Opitutales bacterium]
LVFLASLLATGLRAADAPAAAPAPDAPLTQVPSYPAANSPKDGPPAFASAGKKISLPQGYIIGADLSAVPASEDRGTQYWDQGKQMDILQIMKAHGFNYVRLRIFVDPTAADGYDTRSGKGYCGLEQTIIFGKRIKAAGMGFLLDFHYSDNWADPGKQVKPLAWRDLAFPDLVKNVHDYTKDVVAKLKAAGAEPDMVQPGNEITPGMLLPDGSTKNWDQLAALLKAGIAGTKEVDPNIIIMLHIDKGGNNQVTHQWVDNALARGVEFDVLGESCYSNTAWQGPITKQVANFADLVKSYPNLYFINDEYGGSMRNADNDQLDNNDRTKVVLKKPDWSTDGLDWSKRWANDMMFDIPGEKGLGAFSWEPTQNNNQQTLFTTVNGHPTANQEMYMFDAMAKRYASRMKPAAGAASSSPSTGK